MALLSAIVSVSGAAALIGACGGSDSTITDGGNDATTGDTGTPGDGAMGDTGTDTGAPDVGPGGCHGLGNFGCRTCCGLAYPDAAAFYLDQERTCGCTTPGDCKSAAQCGNNLCNGNTPNNACDQCLRNKDAGDCTAVATAACLNDTTCQPLVACVASCTGAADAGGGG